MEFQELHLFINKVLVAFKEWGKKILLIVGLGLATTAGVTAAVLSNGNKKAKKETKKENTYKKECSRSTKTACY